MGDSLHQILRPQFQIHRLEMRLTKPPSAKRSLDQSKRTRFPGKWPGQYRKPGRSVSLEPVVSEEVNFHLFEIKLEAECGNQVKYDGPGNLFPEIHGGSWRVMFNESCFKCGSSIPP